MASQDRIGQDRMSEQCVRVSAMVKDKCQACGHHKGRWTYIHRQVAFTFRSLSRERGRAFTKLLQLLIPLSSVTD